tara:strand:- start:3921 stop:5168 length:1248 start_codon:yes stop_codon:yes gene_type:complete
MENSIMKNFNSDSYIQNNPLNKIDKQYLINHVQDKLNELINSFLNGGFSSKGFIFYPLVKDISKDNKVKIKKLRKILYYLNNKDINFSKSIEKFEKIKKINSKNFAILLSTIYEDFSSIKKNKTKTLVKRKCNKINFREYDKSDRKLIEPIKDLKTFAEKNLIEYISGFYLHGSFSTLDYIKGWSDLDTLIILKKSTINEPDKLSQLRDFLYKSRKFFYKIDPLQHHGHMIITQYDLEHYCPTYFPVEIFKYSKSFLEKEEINKIKVRDCKIENLNKFYWFVDYFRKLYLKRDYRMNSYHMKFFLHCITLFPTLYLEAKGIHVYKKHSFGIVKKDFKKDLWKPILTVEKIRQNWKPLKALPFITQMAEINPLLGYQINSRFFNISQINNINTKYLIEEMYKTSKYAYIKIKEGLR